MFGTNSIVGQRFFKDAPAESLFVTSMFFTLQGEGPYNGMPALFIRLTKCNLACSFCDTFFDDGDWMTFEEIERKAAKTIKSYWEDKNLKMPAWVFEENGLSPKEYFKENKIVPKANIVLVITGGEPTLQKNLTEFLQRQITRYKAVQIESNGTINLEILEGVTLVCSPKCAEKNGVATKYIAPTKQILERADCLKFVMSADQNSPYSNIPDWAHEWKNESPSREIYISPMNIYNTFPQKIKLLRSEKDNITMEERSTVDEKINFFEPGLLNMEAVARNHEYVGKYCMDHGLRMNMQMHLFANLS
jgi:7-carboxy-7-deazaguanine synthase